MLLFGPGWRGSNAIRPTETARVHHAAGRRGGGVAARGARAAGRAHAAHWRAPELGRGRSGSEVRLMTIRLKILSLAFLILIIFGVVLGISTSLQHDFI